MDAEAALLAALELDQPTAGDVLRLQPGEGLEQLAEVEDGSVDVLLAAGVLPATRSPKTRLALLVAFGRVLRPGGWTAFDLSTDPTVHDPPPRPAAASTDRRAFFKALAGRAAPPQSEQQPRWPRSFIPLDALGATATQAGLELERIEGANTPETLVFATRSRAS